MMGQNREGDLGVESRFGNIKAIITDVDGVLTDGSIVMTPNGEGKTFSVLDGMGFHLAKKSGIQTAILSGRKSVALSLRVEELGISVAKMGRLDKQTALEEISQEISVPVSQMAYIGDDLPDLAPLQMAGVGFCPLDAHEAIRSRAYVVPVPGGKGVFRWVVEAILKARNEWEALVKGYEVKHD